MNRRPQRENGPYICDFNRGVLNTRFCARIQHLLRGHKYRGYSLFAGCLLAGADGIKSQWWGIWGAEIRFSAYTYIVFSSDVYQTIQYITITEFSASNLAPLISFIIPVAKDRSLGRNE